MLETVHAQFDLALLPRVVQAQALLEINPALFSGSATPGKEQSLVLDLLPRCNVPLSAITRIPTI